MQMKFMTGTAAILTLFAAGAVRSVVTAQEKVVTAQEKTVWSGVYTAEQAARGKEKALAACASCHGEMMEGTVAPALKGDDFLIPRYDTKLRELSDKVSLTMPAEDPGSLMPEEYADVLAYLLEINGFPAGETPLSLTPPEALDTITITKQH